MRRLARWHLLNFFPLPHGHRSLRPTFIQPVFYHKGEQRAKLMVIYVGGQAN